ncbi:hypothetical protein POX_e07216 [Penicillium oxalicum]|uniref:hypothetical protein n=1 Tax=Penicillium oxalicum TaxID=69781 RepID=UPI0020B8A64F|nr:hypothetical protein POX_e07216 [Penicillium oxalicum]KAI2789187.1 hypothetical protein POX_e07216 [Penicillium oxalicum]UHS16739.1 phospholipase POX07277 [Penicillium oxalicum]
MGASRIARLSWILPPSALAVYSTRERGRHPQQNYPFTSTAWAESNPKLNEDSSQEANSSDIDNQQSVWFKIVHKLGDVKQSVGVGALGDLGGNITELILPDWTKYLPATAQKLQRELSMAPGSLADEIWKEAHDPDINPEILQDAHVRVSAELCEEELSFRKKRQQRVRKALAEYLDINENDIHPDDVPVIAMCGSGGGLRALVAGTGSYLAAQEAGLWDCITYTAGVSGSCWLQTLYHSSLAQGNFHRLVDHLKNRLGVHLAFPPAALDLLTTAPTNKFLLSGLVEKLKADPNADFGLVDIYGMLLAARLLVPRGELGVCNRDLKISNQRANLLDGAHPMPIYTAVRHEIPIEIENLSDEQQKAAEDMIMESNHESWFQWFEFTPYEFFCEELNAGIPTWALGRHFDRGTNETPQQMYPIPELRVPSLMGIWGSAFCATLSHYYKEVRPLVKGLAGFSGIDSLILGKNEDLIRVHPIDPAAIPNYVTGMKDQLPASCPKSIFEDRHLRLMDAGMSNNLPIYPLIRPGRDVDIIVAFDASADIKQENWLSVVDGYARQRGIKGWPIGAGWPPNTEPLEQTEKVLREPEGITAEQADQKVAQAQEQDIVSDQNQKAIRAGANPDTDLGYCNVWVGTQEERVAGDEPPPSKRLFHPDNSEDHSESDFHLMRPDAGVAVIYFPFLPNPSAPDVAPPAKKARPLPAAQSLQQSRDLSESSDMKPPKPCSINPDVDDFLSTWNFIYTPEQVDSVVGLAKANFVEGKDQVRRVVRAVYERKKKDRLDREAQESRKRMEGFVAL